MFTESNCACFQKSDRKLLDYALTCFGLNLFWVNTEQMTHSVHSKEYRKLCNLLVASRKSAGLSQAALASRLNTVQTYVSKYERGERRIDVIELISIAKALNLDIVALVTEINASVDKTARSQ